MKKIVSLFTEHPYSLNESYWQHFVEAIFCGALIIISGIVCIIHAIFPFLFKRFTRETLTILVHVKYLMNSVKSCMSLKVCAMIIQITWIKMTISLRISKKLNRYIQMFKSQRQRLCTRLYLITC